MNTENNITLKKIAANDPRFPHVIKFSIGYPTEDKILEVIKSYQDGNRQLIGAIAHEQLIGVVGLEQGTQRITIHHISVLPNFRLHGIGKALIEFIKKEFAIQQIVLETDEEAVGFYEKSGFICNPFEGK
jgi:ribosomal protein S18 acetylase RimI-like enzyme